MLVFLIRRLKNRTINVKYGWMTQYGYKMIFLYSDKTFDTILLFNWLINYRFPLRIIKEEKSIGLTIPGYRSELYLVRVMTPYPFFRILLADSAQIVEKIDDGSESLYSFIPPSSILHTVEYSKNDIRNYS